MSISHAASVDPFRSMTDRTPRRELVRSVLAIATTSLVDRGRVGAAEPERLPPVRVVTRPTGADGRAHHHWFGYYDKLQFDQNSRRLLSMAVGFEHRSPRPDDVVTVGFVDLADGDRWTPFGASTAWGWQQGCMLQWRPGSPDEVVWNDRDGDRFVCHVLDLATGRKRTLPRAIYTISPDGRRAFGIDFGRLQRMRPGYGYAASAPAGGDERAPADGGIWSIGLDGGEPRLIVSLADILDLEPQDSFRGAYHWFNHLLVNTDSTRLEFLHRWGTPGGRWSTRMITSGLDGSEPFVLDPGGHTSHFIWRDPDHILAWTRPVGRHDGFWLFRDRTREVEEVGAGVMTANGHCTYLPEAGGGRPRWILNDTYPDRDRLQHPYLFDTHTRRRVALGHFESPKAYAGEWRCDTHPRSSPDGRLVCIDSPVGDSAAGGQGRQLHLIDVSEIVGPPQASAPRPTAS
jgi:hypothetical protein